MIGIIVSTPMGPIGMLVIQRTFLRGRWHGFVTGLGASLSDLIYALITLVGMSFITDILEREETILQLIGSMVLLLFGYTVFRSNPLKGLKPDNEIEETQYRKDFFSSFLLTFSNVAIIFLFIAVYSRFNYTPYENGMLHLIIALASIVFGAICWWFFITTYVSKLRKYISRKGLILMNHVVGLLFMSIGVIGIVMSIFRYIH